MWGQKQIDLGPVDPRTSTWIWDVPTWPFLIGLAILLGILLVLLLILLELRRTPRASSPEKAMPVIELERRRIGRS